MKTIHRTVITLGLSLVVLFLTIGSAAAADVVEIREPVYDGSSITDILTNLAYGDGTTIIMDATQFADFYYDIDDDVTTETLTGK